MLEKNTGFRRVLRAISTRQELIKLLQSKPVIKGADLEKAIDLAKRLV